MIGLRQKLVLGFGGLLAILLIVSALGVEVLTQYRAKLDKFYYENWRSVVYGQNMLEALDRLNTALKPLGKSGAGPGPADLSAAFRKMAFSSNRGPRAFRVPTRFSG